MAKLPKRIIKKHGISKKAWAVFRAEQKGKKKARSTTKRKTKIKTITRRSSKVAKRRKSSRKNNNGFRMPRGVGSLIGPVAYGFMREKLSDTLAQTQIVQKLPATGFTDEAVMLGLNWTARKFGLGKIPIVSSILRSQKQIELARIGQEIKDMTMPSNGTRSGIFVN